MGELQQNITEIPFLDLLTTNNVSEITSEKPDHNEGRDLSFFLLPFSSLLIIVFLTATVILLLKRKRHIDRLRQRLMPHYNFAPGEEDDWETELLESEGEITTRRDYNAVSGPKALPPHEK